MDYILTFVPYLKLKKFKFKVKVKKSLKKYHKIIIIMKAKNTNIIKKIYWFKRHSIIFILKLLILKNYKLLNINKLN